jgi:hypothetical protein
MTMTANLAKLKVLAEDWDETRRRLAAFRTKHAKILDAYAALQQDLTETEAELKALGKDVEIPPGAKQLPVGCGVQLSRKMLPAYLRVEALYGHLQAFVQAGLVGPPSVSAAEKAVKEGKLSPELVDEFRPVREATLRLGTDYTVQVAFPKD